MNYQGWIQIISIFNTLFLLIQVHLKLCEFIKCFQSLYFTDTVIFYVTFPRGSLSARGHCVGDPCAGSKPVLYHVEDHVHTAGCGL